MVSIAATCPAHLQGLAPKLALEHAMECNEPEIEVSGVQRRMKKSNSNSSDNEEITVNEDQIINSKQQATTTNGRQMAALDTTSASASASHSLNSSLCSSSISGSSCNGGSPDCGSSLSQLSQEAADFQSQPFPVESKQLGSGDDQAAAAEQANWRAKRSEKLSVVIPSDQKSSLVTPTVIPDTAAAAHHIYQEAVSLFTGLPSCTPTSADKLPVSSGLVSSINPFFWGMTSFQHQQHQQQHQHQQHQPDGHLGTCQKDNSLQTPNVTYNQHQHQMKPTDSGSAQLDSMHPAAGNLIGLSPFSFWPFSPEADRLLRLANQQNALHQHQQQQQQNQQTKAQDLTSPTSAYKLQQQQQQQQLQQQLQQPAFNEQPNEPAEASKCKQTKSQQQKLSLATPSQEQQQQFQARPEASQLYHLNGYTSNNNNNLISNHQHHQYLAQPEHLVHQQQPEDVHFMVPINSSGEAMNCHSMQQQQQQQAPANGVSLYLAANCRANQLIQQPGGHIMTSIGGMMDQRRLSVVAGQANQTRGATNIDNRARQQTMTTTSTSTTGGQPASLYQPRLRHQLYQAPSGVHGANQTLIITGPSSHYGSFSLANGNDPSSQPNGQFYAINTKDQQHPPVAIACRRPTEITSPSSTNQIHESTSTTQTTTTKTDTEPTKPMVVVTGDDQITNEKANEGEGFSQAPSDSGSLGPQSQTEPSQPIVVKKKSKGGRKKKLVSPDELVARKNRSKERNRVAAKRCRQKRKRFLGELNQEIDKLKEENDTLRRELEGMRRHHKMCNLGH